MFIVVAQSRGEELTSGFKNKLKHLGYFLNILQICNAVNPTPMLFADYQNKMYRKNTDEEVIFCTMLLA